MPVADRTLHGGIVGRAGEYCRHCVRVRQGEVDRFGTETRRKPQGGDQDVRRRLPRPAMLWLRECRVTRSDLLRALFTSTQGYGCGHAFGTPCVLSSEGHGRLRRAWLHSSVEAARPSRPASNVRDDRRAPLLSGAISDKEKRLARSGFPAG